MEAAPHSSGLSGLQNWCRTDNSSWRVSMPVTMFAAIDVYLRDYWATVRQTPTCCGHMDWPLTVPNRGSSPIASPRQCTGIGFSDFWRLSIGTVVMWACFDYIGEPRIQPMVFFAIGMTIWVFIWYEVLDEEDAVGAEQGKDRSLFEERRESWSRE